MGKNVIKGIFGATVCAITLFGFTLNVHAEKIKVTDENSLRDCVQGNNTCILQSNITLTQNTYVRVDNAEVTLDLNGFTIDDGSLTLSNGIVVATNGAKLTINDATGKGKINADSSYAALQVGTNSTLIVNNGTYIGVVTAITGNGTEHNTNITINNGSFIAAGDADNTFTVGIYHPQNGTLTINGGYIEGSTGIEMRAGNLVVNNGTIVGNGDHIEITPNGSGATTYGVGIAIAQHTTKLPIDVKINGGTVKGSTALYESNPQNNDSNAIDEVKIAVTGGNFEASNEKESAIYSEDVKEFITGGTFNTDVTDYVATGVETSENNGVFTVGKDIPEAETPEVNAPVEENTPNASENVNIENPQTADELPMYLIVLLLGILGSGICIKKLA